ncbi:MAG: Verru_Chthon cassette protein C [Chthoniobacteraceae bacterium]|nr:Verru_Chthon cassette protein C [Chthoniobacteraceae bacterium]
MRSLISPRHTGSAFTLVELLVSVGILSLLLLMLASITDATRRTWTYTTGKVEEFRDAREAFESITRKLSQATLNTYWDYEYPSASGGAPDTTQPPKRYVRQSELRFISGSAATLTGSSSASTHAVFFQAPLGYVNDTAHFADLNNLLNTWGYFIEFASDKGSRPPFLDTLSPAPPERWRFRLMELMEPSESLTLYDEETAVGNANYNKTTWFTKPLAASPRPVRVLAENIVALVILPRLPQGEKDASNNPYNAWDLAQDYSYDSTLTKADAALNPKNQLPPVVQVTLVAVDEASYGRLQSHSSGAGLDFSDLFSDASQYETDVQKLRDRLRDAKLNYCVFTTNVSLKAAKWSRAQTN